MEDLSTSIESAGVDWVSREARRFALEKAINTLTRQPTTHTPQDIVHVAEIFYEFLKGEKK